MTQRQYTAIKKRKQSHTGLLIVILLVITILIAAAGLGVYAMQKSVDTVVDSSDIIIITNLIGDSISVTVTDNSADMSLRSIIIVMEGYNIPAGVAQQDVDTKSRTTTLVYDNMAYGMTGEKQLAFKGVFADQSIKTIWVGTLILS